MNEQPEALRLADAMETADAYSSSMDGTLRVKIAPSTLDSAAAELRRLHAALGQVQKPIAWVYPEGLQALKSGKPWVAYGTDGDRRIPLFLYNDAVAPRVEPRASESGAGFESLPASPPTEKNT